MTESLFGVPTNLTINDLGIQPLALHFSEWLEGIFPANGLSGCPDPGTNPMGCFQYLNNRRQVIIDAGKQKPLIRLADKNLEIIAVINDEMSCTCEELMADSGKAVCIIRLDHWLTNHVINETSVYEDLHLIIDPVPSKPDWRTRWGGKITDINIKRHEDGTGTVELHAISMREHAKRLLFAANPIFPPEVQLPRMWVVPGPTRSILMLSMFINLARLFVPGLSTITNVFNPAGWLNPLNPDALLNLNPLSWPIQVAFVNPIIDQSRWSLLSATWTDWHSAMNDMLADSGVACRCYTWLTTDADSPHTELTDLITGATEIPVDILTLLGLDNAADLVNIIGDDIASLTRPRRNCVVFSLDDDSGQTGPTGTALDGFLNLIAVTGDDLITATVVEVNTGEEINGEPVFDASEPTAPVLQTLLGVAPAVPKVIWRDGLFTGMLTSEVNMHKAPVLTTMVGGRSPTLVNETQTFAIRYGLAQLSDAINIAIGASINFTPASYTWQTPATPGLDNLYQGQLDNVLFAWERYTDPVRALWSGDLAFQEYFERSSGSAYTLAAWLGLREGNFKTRPFYGFQTQVINGRPWMIDIDVRLGQRAGFEMSGVIYVDQITAVKRTYDRKTPVIVSMSIGDDRNKHDPIARAIRVMQAIYSLVGSIAGEGTIFN